MTRPDLLSPHSWGGTGAALCPWPPPSRCGQSSEAWFVRGLSCLAWEAETEKGTPRQPWEAPCWKWPLSLPQARIPVLLGRMKEAGKVFLATNSSYNYTHVSVCRGVGPSACWPGSHLLAGPGEAGAL